MTKSSGIVRSVEAFLCAQPNPIPVPATLLYNTADPWAVKLSFTTGEPKPIEWMLDRELLGDGLLAPTGEGNVRIKSAGPDWTIVELKGVARNAVNNTAQFLLKTQALLGFLDATYKLVQRGDEGVFCDVDAELRALDLIKTY